MFYYPDEWLLAYKNEEIEFPLHYVGKIQEHANKYFLREFRFKELYPDKYIFTTLDNFEIFVSNFASDAIYKNRQDSYLIRSIERPTRSLEYIIRLITEQDEILRDLLSFDGFASGIIPGSVINAGVQPSPSGGNVVILNDGVFMSPWAFSKYPSFMNSIENVSRNNISENDIDSIWDFFIASMNLIGAIAGPKLEEEARHRRSTTEELNYLGTRQGNWKASEVYGDGKSEASSYGGLLSYFVTLHEIGHIFNGDCEILREQLLGNNKSDVKGSFDKEFAADKFAVEWLMKTNQLSNADLGIFHVILFPFFLGEIALEVFVKERNSNTNLDLSVNAFALNSSTHPSWVDRLKNILLINSTVSSIENINKEVYQYFIAPAKIAIHVITKSKRNIPWTWLK